MQSTDFCERQHTNLSCSLISNPSIGSNVDLLLLLAFLIGDQLCWFYSWKANTHESQTKAAVFERFKLENCLTGDNRSNKLCLLRKEKDILVLLKRNPPNKQQQHNKSNLPTITVSVSKT